MKSRMTEMVTFGSVRGTYNPQEVRNGFYSTCAEKSLVYPAGGSPA